jgi:hypothetical protein
MKKWLFPKRIGRLSWFLRVVIGLSILQLVRTTELALPFRQYAPYWLIASLACLVVFAGVAYIIFFIHLPRARSLGLHGGYLLILLIPPLNMLLVTMLLFGSEGYWIRFRQGQTTPTSNQPTSVNKDTEQVAGRSDANS